jgi:hypothetical protein
VNTAYLDNSNGRIASYYEHPEWFKPLSLSNFVADAPNVVGFDPFPRLVDYLVQRAGIAAGAAVGV